MTSAIFSDVDNTLYNFVDFFGPAFRAMLHVLARETMNREEDLIREFQHIYEKYQTLEYPFSVQELGSVRQCCGEDPEALSRLVHSSLIAFSRSRRLRLQPYPFVRDTLRWLKLNGYFLIAYTDAPYRQALGRLHNLGLRSFFDVLIAWGPQKKEYASKIKEEDDLYYKWFDDPGTQDIPKSDLVIRTFPFDKRKPSKELLCEIMSEFSIDAGASWLVGDNPDKDLVPARSVGLNDVWARYGLLCEKKNLETVLRVTPGQRRSAPDRVVVSPTYAIDSFDELRKLVPTVQLEMFPFIG